ncbi:Glycoside hydrolase [Macleaya cordata]|uniref:mannan endo-1,4-beta-mannosidase n=1 Tax=Macleaya cordata TaxID=56857 RepID=A0A200QI06_MACCD|nr:Glycoside hydrolase [Macleaya cordata]
MEPLWRKRVYPLLSFLTLAALLYLNFGDKFRFPMLWLPKMNFVGTNSTRFVITSDSGEESTLYINGWNSYWLMEESVWEESRTRVSEMIRRGAQMGMTVCRTWAFSDGNSSNSLQISPGVFDERVFQGLDFVILEARRHQIRLILSLVNNLNAFGGKAQYVRWAQQAGANVTSLTDSFFSHPTIKDYYKNYIKAVVTRKNSLTGVKYSEEPAIFAWELMNEPRTTSNLSAPVLQTWIAEMAAFTKSLDQNHLVTVGLEGFYGPKTTERSAVNPGTWAASLGSDFIQNSAVENIDFASVHAYPDSWIPQADSRQKADYLSHWVDSHVSDGEHVLKKPVLFTEVGSSLRMKKGVYDRDYLLKMVYDKIYESAKKRQAGAGALIWQLLVEGMEHYGDQFSLVAWKYPSTYELIIEQSCRLRRVFEKGLTNRKLRHSDPCYGRIS